MSKFMNLKPIVSPKSIAIIGASDNPQKVGNVILKNNMDSGFPGKIYPVNISGAGTIMGIRSYRSVLDIHAPVDLAVIAIPAMAVPKALDECGKAKVKGAVVVSGCLCLMRQISKIYIFLPPNRFMF